MSQVSSGTETLMPPKESRPSGRSWTSLPALAIVLVLAGLGIILFRPAGPVDSEAEEEAIQLAAPVSIDGQRAYRYLKEICAIGPRPAGTAANTRQREMVAKHFKAMGATLTEQPFSTADPKSGERVDMVNLIGSWNPDRKERIVIGVHYDTRPFPDEDLDPAKRRIPFIGANDGASGVALLMEIAHHLAKLETPWGVDLVLFDGEEIVYKEEGHTLGEFFLGSKEFARLYAEGVETRRLPYRYVAGLVLDMVGDKNLRIEQEDNSVNLAPDIVRSVWSVAKKVKATAFINRVGPSVLDDHLALNNAGIPAIDIIDFAYPTTGNAYWHTSNDLPENCSAASLEQVGRVVVSWLTLPKRVRR